MSHLHAVCTRPGTTTFMPQDNVAPEFNGGALTNLGSRVSGAQAESAQATQIYFLFTLQSIC